MSFFTLSDNILTFGGQIISEEEKVVVTKILIGFDILARFTSPPSSPIATALYLVKPPATGGWAGKDNLFAIYLNNRWLYFPPGFRQGAIYLVGEDILIKWDGDAWVLSAPPSITPGDDLPDLTTKGQLITHDGDSLSILSVGTNGQVLTANSNVVNGVEWADIPITIPPGSSLPELTQKGQLITHDGSDPVLLDLVETDDHVLTVDTSAESGVAWKPISITNFLPFTGKGQLFTYDGNNPSVLSVGSTGQFLRANSSNANGIEWGDIIQPSVKGQLLTHNGTNVSTLPVGSNNAVLVSDSTATSGIRWQSNAVPTSLGTLVVGNIGNVPAILSAGTNGQFLMADNGVQPGVRWNTIVQPASRGALVSHRGDFAIQVSGPTGNQMLICDPAEYGQTGGLIWRNINTALGLSAKGHLISYTGTGDLPAALAVGTNGQFLMADSSTATGLRWTTPNVVPFDTTATTTYNITIANRNRIIEYTGSTNTTFTCSNAITSGFQCEIFNLGTGTITILGTEIIQNNLRGKSTLAPNEGVRLRFDGTFWLSF